MQTTRAVIGTLAALAVCGAGCNHTPASHAGGPDAGGVGGASAAGGSATGAGGSATDAGGSQGATGGASGTAGAGTFTAVDPQVSRKWRWSSCGSIPAMTASAVQAIFPPAGDALAVLYDDGRVLLYPKDGSASPQLLRPQGTPPTSIAFSLDGSELAEVSAGAVAVRDVATGTILRNMTVSGDCTGDAVRFSVEGDHVLAWDDKSLCVWQTADGALVGQWLGNFTSAGMKNGQVLTAEVGSPVSVKSRSLSGTDIMDIALELPPGTVTPSIEGTLAVSPRVDTVAGVTADSTRLANLWSAGGKLMASFTTADDIDTDAIYAESGALVLMANQVLDVASNLHWTNSAVDDSNTTTLSATGMLVAGLSPVDGAHFAAYIAENGNLNTRRLFGSLPPADPSSSSTSLPTVLSVSPDGASLATASLAPPGSLLWRLSTSFAASVPIRAIQQVSLEASFSADGREVGYSGDGWGIFSADDGSFLDTIVPPPTVADGCWFTSAHFSAGGPWLAIGTTGATMNIVTRDDLQFVAALPTARCRARSSFNGDGSLVALSGPEVYRTSDWSLIWPSQIVAEPPPSLDDPSLDFFRDAQFAPGEQTLLVSRCDGPGLGTNCRHALQAVSNGAVVQQLPQLTSSRARFSGEGNWVVSGPTVLHVPTNESLTFDPNATLSTFAPNGDIIAILKDDTLARYCRSP
jgi:hypothetical protein